MPKTWKQSRNSTEGEPKRGRWMWREPKSAGLVGRMGSLDFVLT